VIGATAIALQLSAPPIRKRTIEPWCRHLVIVTASCVSHQLGHSRAAFGPIANASTIERTAARNTVILARWKGNNPASARALAGRQ
jgi:hypothetical protein